ncbi:MAG TPA: hypothetical protein VN815_11870 [Steroidobacteraceae bacterium]|nr:hypothetical protein [Steroidobacteraceae bacterium]
MSSKMRRNFTGAFISQNRGGGAWHLIRSAPHEATVYVRGAQRDALDAFGLGQISDLGIEWGDEEALLTFMSGGKASSVAAGSVIVHEPLDDLYASLPLAGIDADARRFWRRIFALVRLPGGRVLLRLLTRSRKGR